MSRAPGRSPGHRTLRRNAIPESISAPPPSGHKTLTAAVLLALGAMNTMPVSAAAITCNMWGPNIISTGPWTSTCFLGSGSSLEVTSPNGLISVVGGPGVSVESNFYRVDFIDNKNGITSVGSAGINAAGGEGTGIRAVSNIFTSSLNLGSISNSSVISGKGGAGGGTAGMTGMAGGAGRGISAALFTIGDINNSGTILGTGGNGGSTIMPGMMGGAGGAGTGISIAGSRVGTITNTAQGSITGVGGAGGTDMTGGIGGIGGLPGIGLVSRGASTGISISASTVAAIVNSGMIAGDVAIGIDANSTITNGITNSGTIAGAVKLNTATLNLDGGSISGTVSGTNASIVNVRDSFTSGNTFNVGAFNITSSGHFNMGHGVTTANLSNAGTLSVAAGTSATITGNYTQATGGTFESRLTDASTYGKLAVTGTADFSASNKIQVNVIGTPVLLAGTSIQPGVISAGTLVAPNGFTVADNSALFDFIASRNGNAVDLCVATAGSATCAAPVVVPDPVPDPVPNPVPNPVPQPAPAPAVTVVSSVTAAKNNPGLGAAAVFDGLIAKGNTVAAAMVPVITALGNLPTEQKVSDAVKQTLPLMAAGMAGINSAGMHSTNRVIQARQEANKGLSSGDGFITDRQFWFKPLGSWARQDDRNGVSGYKANTAGMVFGADKVVTRQVRLGAAFSYMHTSVDGNSTVAMQQATVEGYRVIGYGSYSLDPRTDLSFQADVGHGRNEGQRSINFGGLNSTAAARYNSWNAHVGVGLGRTLDLAAKTTFTPSVRADYTYMRDQAYTETGAGALNLDVARNITKELILSVDGRLNRALTERTVFTANLGAGYDTLTDQSSITAAFVGGGGQFTTRGLSPSPWLARGGLGIIMTNNRAMEITARYDAEARQSFINHTASVKLRMPF
ncbi:MAG: Outer rane autotransporter barrel [Paucimonas sp.]|nr:Outer rane autotransporter barrel [Paucimonas sp.]